MQFANKLRFAVLATVLLGCTQILAVEHIHQHGGHSVQHRHHNRHAAEIAPLNTRELEGYFVAREDVAVDARDQLLKPHGHKRKHRSRKQKVKKHAKSRKTSTAFALPASAEALTTGVSSTPSSSSPVVNSRDFDDAFELDARESHAKQAHKHNSKARKHRKGQGKHRKKTRSKTHKKKGRKHAKQATSTDATSVSSGSSTPDASPTTSSAVFARELDFDLESRGTKKSIEHSKGKTTSKKQKKHAKKGGKNSGFKLIRKVGKKSNKRAGRKHGKKTSEQTEEATLTERPSTQMKASTSASAISKKADQTLDAREDDWTTMNRINRINQAKSQGRSVKSSGGGLFPLIKHIFHKKKAAPAAIIA